MCRRKKAHRAVKDALHFVQHILHNHHSAEG
jgi:hypothetical protein